MFGWIRVVVGFSMVASATPFLLLWQMFAMAVGLDEAPAPRLWHRLILKALGFRVRVTGRLASGRPLLIAANHISWTDIMVLGSVADVHFIAKAEMARWPVMGFLARYQRTIFVERERRRKSGEQVNEVAGRLAAGHAVVLFPEGTTHDGNFLGPFKSTLFGAAAAAIANGGARQVHVQPVAIAYTRLHGLPMARSHRPHVAWIGEQTLLPHLIGLLREGAVDVEVRFGEAFVSDGSTHRKHAARRAETEVRAMMNEALGAPVPSREG